MFKNLYLLLALLLFSSPLFAQTTPTKLTPPTVAPDSGAVLLFNGWYLPIYKPAGAEADTTGALLALFIKQRRAGYAFVIPFFTGMFLAVPLSTNHGGYTQTAEKAISPPLGIPILAATVVGFIIHSTAYNKGHLLAVDQAYAAGKPIPAKYRRRLKQHHFVEAAALREALFQQMRREQRLQPTTVN